MTLAVSQMRRYFIACLLALTATISWGACGPSSTPFATSTPATNYAVMSTATPTLAPIYAATSTATPKPLPTPTMAASPSRLLKNGVWQWDRVLKTLILRSSWRKLGRWSRTLGLCCFLNPVLRGCRAWVAHCQVMPPWLLALPLPAPGVWPYGPDCRPWLPGTPPDRSGPAPDIASFGTRPLFSSTRRSPQPVSESAD